MPHIDLRWRVLAFITSLMILAVVHLKDGTKLLIACAIYLLVVYPEMFRDRR